MSKHILISKKPTFLLGVNYWSRVGGPGMWDHFDANAVRAETAQMRNIGLNTCRSFAFIPSLMPKQGTISQTVLDQMKQFLQICEDEKINTIPSFFVGHMSGENYDFVGQNKRSPYTDPQIIDWQKLIVEAIASIGKTSPAVIAYLASNEMPLWGGETSPSNIQSWAAVLRKTLHEIDKTRPFSLGDGVMNLKGGQNGFDVNRLNGLIDFVGPHTYYTDNDPRRQALNAEFCIRSLTYLGIPVLLEEFGCSSCQVSEQNQALYYREAIHGCLTSGAAGALGWCFSDFDLVDEPPYSHHAFELTFGITRADGSEKPVCNELRNISKLIDTIDFPNLKTPALKTAIVVPSYFNTNYPFSWEEKARMRRSLLQSYVLCASAGLEVELVPEEHDLSKYKLLVIPSTQKLLSPTWRFLLQHAQKGNTIYWSYFSGDYNFHQGSWCHDFTALTGCEHELRYGCYDLPSEQLNLNGPDLNVSVNTAFGTPYPRAYLPIKPLPSMNTTVLAKDDKGQPAFTKVKCGQGQFLFLNCPWEYYLAEQANINANNNSSDIYSLIAKTAGLEPSISCNNPGVQVRIVESTSGSLLWLINHDWSDCNAKINSPSGTPLFGTNDKLSDGSKSIQLRPKQVLVYRLES